MSLKLAKNLDDIVGDTQIDSMSSSCHGIHKTKYIKIHAPAVFLLKHLLKYKHKSVDTLASTSHW